MFNAILLRINCFEVKTAFISKSKLLEKNKSLKVKIKVLSAYPWLNFMGEEVNVEM